MTTVRSHLWFDDQALPAAQHYAALLPDTRVTSVVQAPAGTPGVADGAPFIVELELVGVPFTFLNGGPALRLDAAFSVLLQVDTREEVDRYWDALTADGGQPGQCGWLVDQFGVSWQVVPAGLTRVMSGSDPAGVARAMAVMLTMSKLEVAPLEAAYAGR